MTKHEFSNEHWFEEFYSNVDVVYNRMVEHIECMHYIFNEGNYSKGLDQVEETRQILLEHPKPQRPSNELTTIEAAIYFVGSITTLYTIVIFFQKCVKLVRELELKQLRDKMVNSFKLEELDNTYREVCSFITHNHLIATNYYDKYPEYLVELTKTEIKQLIDNKTQIGDRGKVSPFHLGNLKQNGIEGNFVVEKNMDFIQKEIASIDSTGWKYCFRNETDFNSFSELLAKYFANESYELPNEFMKVKKGCKTRLSKALGSLHKELSEKPLKSDHEYMRLVQTISVLADEKDLYKALTR